MKIKNLVGTALSVSLFCSSAFSPSLVHAESYDQQLDAIISEIITENMTDLEKITAITKYVAEEYHYTYDDLYYQRWTDMLDYGGGDCWANTELITKLLEKIEIDYIRRDDSLNAGSGSGHICPIAFADGAYYQLETGFFGENPRPYVVTNLGTVPYEYSISDDSAVFNGYFGSETDFIIPSEIAGVPVTAIQTYAFSTKQLTDFSYNNSKLCFTFWKWDFSHVESVTIPETVTDINSFAFAYSKLKDVTIPETVLNIGSQAFYGCEDITEVRLSNGLETIGENVFGGCGSLTDIYYDGTVEEWQALTEGIEIGTSDNVVIHFAGEVVKGDINDSGKIDVEDLELLSDYILGKTPDNSLNWDNADMNDDGFIDTFDVVMLRKALV